MTARTINNLIIYKIGKAASELPYYMSVTKLPNPGQADTVEAVTALFADRRLETAQTQTRLSMFHDHPKGLSVEIEDGCNLYLFMLAKQEDGDRDTKARFGPSVAPMQILPADQASALPIFDDGLCHYDGAALRRWPSDKIPSKIGEVPDDAFLMFGCDKAAMMKYITDETAAATPPGGDNKPKGFKIPFYFNFYDIGSKLPIWALDDHHGAQARWHGGIHPDTAVSFLYGGN